MKRVDAENAAPPETLPLVLYVEDEPDNWEVTELRLRRRYRLLWARTDVEACALARQYGPSLHAVLMDVQLKGSALDGLALTRLFRGKLATPPAVAEGVPTLECPIFFVTAYGNLHSAAEFDEAGGDAHVPKPVDFFKLNNLLARENARRAMASLKR
jgi:CheY-like chemotaxis protein